MHHIKTFLLLIKEESYFEPFQARMFIIFLPRNWKMEHGMFSARLWYKPIFIGSAVDSRDGFGGSWVEMIDWLDCGILCGMLGSIVSSPPSGYGICPRIGLLLRYNRHNGGALSDDFCKRFRGELESRAFPANGYSGLTNEGRMDFFMW